MPPTTPITTPFGFDSTAAEVVAGVDLTGAARSSPAARRASASRPPGRSPAPAPRSPSRSATRRGRARRRRHRRDDRGRRVAVAPLDLADQDSVAAFVAAWSGPLHILVNNAGVMAIPDLRRTPEGWEMQFATNHLGHFALAVGLHDALAAAGGARIVAVSSAAHLRSPVVFDDLHFEYRAYDPALAYGQSKTANVLFAVEATAAGRRTASPPTPCTRARSPTQPRAPHGPGGPRRRLRERAGLPLQDARAGRRDVGAGRDVAAASTASAGATSSTAPRPPSSTPR